ADSGLSAEGESDREDPASGPPCSRGDSGSQGASGRGAEGAPCPGGPVPHREAEGSEEEEEEEEGQAEQDATVPCSSLCVTEPGQDLAEPESPTQPRPLTEAASPGLGTVDDCPASPQGPGGPGQAEGPPRDPQPHADPGWLVELLSSPKARGSPQDLLGWSRKDLCSEFGIGRVQQAGTFDWTPEAVERDRDWPGETEQDREFGTKSSWDSIHSTRDGDRQDGPFGTTGKDWGRDYKGTELMAEARLGCSNWSKSHGTEESCLQDQDFGAGKPNWGTGYGLDGVGSGEEIGSGKADWSHSYNMGHGQQQDEEPSSRQPSWAGRYGPGAPESQDGEITPAWAGQYGTSDAEVKDRELTPDWASKYSSRDAESKNEDFTLGWAGRSSTGDTGTPEKEFSPSRPAWDSKYSTRDMESQDREFSPSRPAWTGEYSTRGMQSQDREFSPSRPAEADEYTTRDMESQDRDGFKPSQPAWDDRYSTRDVKSQDREFSPSRPAWASEFSSSNAKKEEREFSSGRLSWAGECGISQTELVDAFGVRKDDLPGSGAPDPPAQEPGWGSTGHQERGATDSRDWAEELGGAEHHNQFGIIGTEWVTDPSSARAISDGSTSWAGGMRSGGLRETLGDWQRDLSFGTPDATSCVGTGDASGVGLGQMAWGQGLGHLPAPGSSAQPREARLEGPGWSQELEAAGWSVELCDAEAKRREWASAFGARCAARSRDFGAGEQSPGDDAGSADGRTICLLDPSPPMGDTQADLPAAASPRHKPPSLTEEERDLPEPAAAPRSPRASPLLPEAAGGTLLDTGSEESPSDHPDGKRPPSWEEKRLSLGAPQPEGRSDHAGQEFTFLEDTEVLDSSVYRSKANLGRKRRHRAPALRPGATSEGDSWIFRDSTEPRPAPAASSDEEAVEEPKSRRVRASLSSKGVKVPLFPGLSTSALKAKLRGRNRSAEEGSPAGDSKATPPKDPHVQRSKSCKIPGLSGKPLVLSPKPEKSS
ncbi:TB182 protein, partial [Stercorarius parasiticus]|nr:TB182 protein [Stercorarius parasiticus]